MARSAKDALSAWRRLDVELDAWRAARRQADLWCRDDDACRDSPELSRLVEIAGGTNVPVALAVIPAFAEPSLIDAVAKADVVTVVQHGYAHRNHAPAGARNWELGNHRPLHQLIAELEEGRTSLERHFGRRFAPMLVPPWNRIDPGVIGRLPEAGFRGLSTFGPRAQAAPVAGLVQCNTHVDLIAWRRDRAFIGVDAAIDRLVLHLAARREGTVDPSEPTGLLTHHLDLDAAAWRFLADLFAHTRQHGAATWIDVHAAFGKVGSDTTFLRPR
jgi:hypothetical protein